MRRSSVRLSFLVAIIFTGFYIGFLVVTVPAKLQPTEINVEPIQPPEELLQREWNLAAAGTTALQVPVPPLITLEFSFSQESRLSNFTGNDSCGSFYGWHWHYPDQKIRIGGFLSGFKACLPESLLPFLSRINGAYKDVLESVDSYELKNNHLRLYYDNDTKYLLFTAE